MSVGANRIAAQALIFFTSSLWAMLAWVRALTSSFWERPTRVRFTLSMFCSSWRNPPHLLGGPQGMVLHVAQDHALRTTEQVGGVPPAAAEHTEREPHPGRPLPERGGQGPHPSEHSPER